MRISGYIDRCARIGVTEIQNKSGFNFLKYFKNFSSYIRFIFKFRRLENCLDIIICKIIWER